MNHNRNEVLNQNITELYDRVSKETVEIEQHIKIISMLITGFECLKEDNSEYAIASLVLAKNFLIESGENISAVLHGVENITKVISQENTGNP